MTQPNPNNNARLNFGIGSMIAVMLVLAFCFVSLAYLVMARDGNQRGVFWFSPYTAMMPMGLMIIVCWSVMGYRMVKRYTKYGYFRPPEDDSEYDIDRMFDK